MLIPVMSALALCCSLDIFRLRRRFGPHLLGLVLSAGLCPSVELSAGEKIIVAPPQPTDRRSWDQIDHAPWETLLQRYVNEQGLVAYAAWKRSADDQRQLLDYLHHLSSAAPRLAHQRESKIAAWINAYNALTIYGILREYPTTSIRNHTAQLFGYNIWKDLQLQISGQNYSLDDIEHHQLRPLREPRIHFALVCASLGCPRLLNHAYQAEQLDKQLDSNAQHFFRQPQNFRHDVAAGRLELSAILDWYGEDFGNTEDDRLAAIAPFLPTLKARAAAIQGAASVRFLDYNWQLNDQDPPP